MQQIYLDNACTSSPKAPDVARAMEEYINLVCANVARGGYESAYSAAERVQQTREMIAEEFGVPDAKQVIFTSGATMSLNMALLGFLKPCDHVLTSSMEHNAVMRPLTLLTKKGVTHTCVQCNEFGRLDPATLESAIQPNTKAVVMVHASNVSGTILPVAQVGEICRRHNLRFIVDASQSAGLLPLSLDQMGIDALAFPAHKGLMGPPGIGCLLLSAAFAQELRPVFSGGTGSRSDLLEMPEFLPDKLEAGTPNLVGIYGLHAALVHLRAQTASWRLEKEMELCRYFLDRLSAIKNVRVLGLPDVQGRVAVISLDFLTQDNAAAAFALEQEYGIMVRCGLQCAPMAHRTLGSFPTGSVRFSISHTNTKQQLDTALAAVEEIARRA